MIYLADTYTTHTTTSTSTTTTTTTTTRGKRKAKNVRRVVYRVVVMASVASIQIAFGFVVVPPFDPRTKSIPVSQDVHQHQRQGPLSLPPPRAPFVSTVGAKRRRASTTRGLRWSSSYSPSSLLKYANSNDEKDDAKQQQQQLIIPINAAAINPKNFGDSNDAKTNAKANIVDANPVNETTKQKHHTILLHKHKINLRRKWRRLKPGQKFRFRLGIAALACVSLWDTVVVRNYGGFVNGIVTGAAATTTATGFGGLLRRWFALRGFQGIAALGRSVAYGWAILVAYPRMLDRRAKERRLKREEEALKQWSRVLKGIADEVLRLKRELSLLEGEIRTFRREILAIRAGRVVNNNNNNSNNNSNTGGSRSKINGINESDESDHYNNYNHNSNNTGSNELDRVLRDAIISEMNHLTRLRDDTRLALTTARQRWSEVRAKRPTNHSKPSSFDPLDFDFEFDAAATDMEYRYDDRDNRSDDLLLRGL